MSFNEFPSSFCPFPLVPSDILLFFSFSFFPLYCLLSVVLFFLHFASLLCLYFFFFQVSLPLYHLLFIKPVFSTPLPSQQAPPQGSVYMVSYCVSSCTQTFCICVCMRSCNTHIHQCIQSLVFSFASSLSCQQICLPSHFQSSPPIYQPSLR